MMKLQVIEQIICHGVSKIFTSDFLVRGMEFWKKVSWCPSFSLSYPILSMHQIEWIFFNMQNRVTWDNKPFLIYECLQIRVHCMLVVLFAIRECWGESGFPLNPYSEPKSCCNKHHSVSSGRQDLSGFQNNSSSLWSCWRRLDVCEEPQCCPENVGNIRCKSGLRVLHSVQKISQPSCSIVYTFWLINQWYIITLSI